MIQKDTKYIRKIFEKCFASAKLPLILLSLCKPKTKQTIPKLKSILLRSLLIRFRFNFRGTFLWVGFSGGCRHFKIIFQLD